MKLAELHYSPEQIAYAMRKERLGGKCLISICGAGETLAQDEVIDIVALLLHEGHFVNITSNGTLTKKYERLVHACSDNIENLHVSFSFHYLELVKRNLLDSFFSNIRMVKNAGASILLQINLCDDYVPYWDEIKKISIKQLGAPPQVALTRNERVKPFRIETTLSSEEYYRIGQQFDSPLFRFTFKNFNIKRNEFCYAGDWSGVLNLATGMLNKCYANTESAQNIFEDPDKPINFEAIGHNCKNSYCVNSSHFMSLGIIPEIQTPSYAELRNRKEASWYNKNAEMFLGSKLNESNQEYGLIKKTILSLKTRMLHISRAKGVRGKLAEFKFYQLLHRIKVKVKN